MIPTDAEKRAMAVQHVLKVATPANLRRRLRAMRIDEVKVLYGFAVLRRAENYWEIAEFRGQHNSIEFVSKMIREEWVDEAIEAELQTGQAPVNHPILERN